MQRVEPARLPEPSGGCVTGGREAAAEVAILPGQEGGDPEARYPHAVGTSQGHDEAVSPPAPEPQAVSGQHSRGWSTQLCRTLLSM